MQWISKDLWIICAGFVAAMHVGKLPAAVPVLQAALEMSFVQAGLLLSLVQGAGMCFALLLGSYTEKIGLKTCVLIGLCLLCSASALGALSQSVYMLFILRAIEGFGFLMVTLSGPAYLRQLVAPHLLAAKMGLWTAYMGGGMGLSLMFTPLITAQLGWPATWLVLAALAFILVLIIFKFVPAPSRVVKKIAVLALIKMTLKHPPAWLLACIFGVYAGQWLSLVGFLPSIYQHNQISLQTAGLLTASVSIANAIGTFACGLMMQRGVQPAYLIQVGFVVLFACAIGFYCVQDFWPFMMQYVLVVTFSLAGGLIPAVIFSQALHFAPQSIAISTTVGLILQCSAFTQFMLPPFFANLVSQTGTWFWVGVVMATLSAIGIILSAWLFRTMRLAN